MFLVASSNWYYRACASIGIDGLDNVDMRQDIQRKRFELLCEIDDVCRANKIDYTLFGSMALAALNADDFRSTDCYPITIAMTSGPALRFAEVMEETCPHNRFFEYLGNNENYGRISMRYGNRETLDFSPNTACFYNNHGIFVEIFILRYAAKKSFVNRIERALETELDYTISRLPGRKEALHFNRILGLWKTVSGRASYGKRLFKRMLKVDSSRKMNRVYFKPYGHKREFYPAYWFTHFVPVEFAGREFPVISMIDLFFNRFYDFPWKKTIPSGSMPEPELRIIDPYVPFEDFLSLPGVAEKVQSYGISRSRLTEQQAFTAARSGENHKTWEIVLRSGMRYKLWEEYEPQKEELMRLARQRDFSRLEKRLKKYLEQLSVFQKKKLGLCFDPDIFDAAEAVLVHKGRIPQANALRKLVPREHWNYIDLDLQEYLRQEPKMLYLATEEDLPAIKEFVSRDISKGVYLYLDVYKYGLDNPAMKLWVLKSENTGEITAVVMKYHDSISLVAGPSVVSFDFFAELLEQEQPAMVSGEYELMKQIYPQISDVYDMEEGYVYEITDYRYIPCDVGIEPAGREDMPEAAKLICSDESIGGAYYDIDDLTQQLIERIEDGTARNFKICEEDGTMFAHIATYAEGKGIGVTGGLIVEPSHRDQPYGTFLESHLVKSMRDDGLRAFTFVTNRKRAKLFDAMGGVERSRYGKLTRK